MHRVAVFGLPHAPAQLQFRLTPARWPCLLCPSLPCPTSPCCAFLNVVPTLQGTLLVLDEPTNHLDIPSKETLEEAVRTFEGGWVRQVKSRPLPGCPAGCPVSAGSSAVPACGRAHQHTLAAGAAGKSMPLPPPLTTPPPILPALARTALHCTAGSVIAVSHDRYFLRRIATRIVTVQDGKLVDYQGDYEVGWAAGCHLGCLGGG